MAMAVARAVLLSDEAVYARTAAGQRELILDGDLLRPTARRLLQIINGEISLRRLLDLLQLQDDRVGDAILELVDRGLIELRAASPRAATRMVRVQ